MANGAEPVVRRALEAAAVECITDYWCAQDWQQAEARREAAAAIAAFLRALPDQYSRGGASFWDAIPAVEETRLWLAAAVASAAAEGE